MSRQRFNEQFMWAVSAVGGVASVSSAFAITAEQLDLRLLFLSVLTLLLASRITVSIPFAKGQVTASDTLIFLTLLLCGGEAAILLATAEGGVSSFRYAKTKLTVMFNSAVLALSTFATVWTLRLLGLNADLPGGTISGSFILVIITMAAVQFVVNSGLLAVRTAFKTDHPVWRTWRNHFLWPSVTFFASAAAAGIVAKLVVNVGIYAIILTIPIIAVIYIAYNTYRVNVETSAEKAAQAERHIEELNTYIAEQERIREQYSQIEKLSALGELASGVAHNLNNALTGILGRAQLLLREDQTEKTRRGLEIIVKTAEDGANTIKRIQDFAQQRRDHDFALISVDQLLLDVSEITRPRWKDRSEAANVHINLELRNDSQAYVMGDASELREVLVNMVFNALDAMPQGGRLALAAEQADGYARLIIADTGFGMNADVRSRVFDPFFTTKGASGMGLGLAVSFGIIRRHNGMVEVESEVGRGTSFRIALPLAQEEARGADERPVPTPLAAPVDAARTRILVVDDEDYVRELLRDILTGQGYEVVLASSGDEALALFGTYELDAVFTDVGLPGVNGWEVARIIRENDRNIPVAIITGWGEAVGSEDQDAAGVNWVVTKPFSVERINEIALEIPRRRRTDEAHVEDAAAALAG